MARPAWLLLSAHCKSGSWLPPTISGDSGGVLWGRTIPAASRRSRTATSRHLGAGDLPVGDEFVELALLEPQVVGGFSSCQERRAGWSMGALELNLVRRSEAVRHRLPVAVRHPV